MSGLDAATGRGKDARRTLKEAAQSQGAFQCEENILKLIVIMSACIYTGASPPPMHAHTHARTVQPKESRHLRVPSSEYLAHCVLSLSPTPQHSHDSGVEIAVEAVRLMAL